MHQHQLHAIRQARAWLEQKPLYLDTETTGLSSTDQIIDLALIDHDGTVLIDTLIRPTIPISDGSEAIHRISNEMIVGAPGFDQIIVNLINLTQDRLVLIYNAQFDQRLLRQSAAAYRLKAPAVYAGVHCAMKLYVMLHGKKQTLANAARQLGLTVPADLHRAAADAELCRRIVEAMAATPLPGEAGYDD